jgi:hypothetical protein
MALSQVGLLLRLAGSSLLNPLDDAATASTASWGPSPHTVRVHRHRHTATQAHTDMGTHRHTHSDSEKHGCTCFRVFHWQIFPCQASACTPGIPQMGTVVSQGHSKVSFVRTVKTGAALLPVRSGHGVSASRSPGI